LAVENLDAEHGRGIHLMRLAMDEISFGRNGTEVYMHKQSGSEQGIPAGYIHNRVVRRPERNPGAGVRVVDLHVST
jgi:hypothetical protein